MSVSTGYDPDVGRPKKKPGEHVRTPPRSFKPPPELYAKAQKKAAALGLTITKVLIRALEDFVDGRWKP